MPYRLPQQIFFTWLEFNFSSEVAYLFSWPFMIPRVYEVLEHL
jgi:hypothetical protein